jgi:hypothetical protein
MLPSLCPEQRRQCLPDLIRLAQGAQTLENLQGAGEILLSLGNIPLLLVEPAVAGVGQR